MISELAGKKNPHWQHAAAGYYLQMITNNNNNNIMTSISINYNVEPVAPTYVCDLIST